MGVGGGIGGGESWTWSQAQKDYCCMTFGLGCATTALPMTTPTVPPTPFPTMPPTAPPTPVGPVDPYNCAVGQYFSWDQAKQQWCCSFHHICGQPTQPPAPADPSIVLMGSRIGRLVGQFPRRSGAVVFMAKVARIREGGALHHLTHTIATQASRIGC